MNDRFEDLVERVRACQLCADQLPLGPRPILQVDSGSRILIAGQAPGARVHETGIPFDDPSGDLLRDWMGIDRDTFYDQAKIAILPMGFCYPGKGASGDLPPLPICAATWRAALLEQLREIRLTLVIGLYAQKWHLSHLEKNLTETVRAWKIYGEVTLPLPHPSPRNNIWLKKNPWFETDLIPVLKKRVRLAL